MKKNEEMNKNLSNNFNNNKKTIEQEFNNMKYKHINIERNGRYNSNTNNICINNYIEKIRNKSNKINKQRSYNIYNKNDSNIKIIDEQQIIKFKINKIKKFIKEKNIKLGKFPIYQINKGSKQSIFKNFVNKDNNFLNNNINIKINNNLNSMNDNINQNQQINYRKGYVKNIKQYNKNLLNNIKNYQSFTERFNSNKKYLTFQSDNHKIIQKYINEGITQRSLVRNINDNTANYKNIEFKYFE